MSVFKNLYAYRELLKSNIKKDIRGKYKGSFLGVLWTFLNPLLQVIVYAIVFPYLLRGAGIDNYIVYLVIGIVPWTFFLSSINMGTISIKTNSNIIKKVYFPREILVISQVCSGLINFLISCIIILCFCLAFGVGVSYHLIFLPLIALIQAILILGIVFILSALNVYIQDIEHLVAFALNMMFYGTPIIYSLDQFSLSNGLLISLIRINPMTIIIEAYRDIFLYHLTPDFASLGLVGLFSLAVLVVGYFIFRKLEKGFAEQF